MTTHHITSSTVLSVFCNERHTRARLEGLLSTSTALPGLDPDHWRDIVVFRPDNDPDNHLFTLTTAGHWQTFLYDSLLADVCLLRCPAKGKDALETVVCMHIYCPDTTNCRGNAVLFRRSNLTAPRRLGSLLNYLATSTLECCPVSKYLSSKRRESAVAA